MLGNLWSVCFYLLLIFIGSSRCNLEIKTWMTLDAVAVQLITWAHAHAHTETQPGACAHVCVNPPGTHMLTHTNTHPHTQHRPGTKSRRDILFWINKLWHTIAMSLMMECLFMSSTIKPLSPVCHPHTHTHTYTHAYIHEHRPLHISLSSSPSASHIAALPPNHQESAPTGEIIISSALCHYNRSTDNKTPEY